MSAPNTKYSTEYLNGVVGGETKKLVRQALALTEYTNDTTFKSKFFCDNVTHRTDNSSQGVVIGMVQVGTDNYNHHAEGRLSHLRSTINGQEYVLCNDSGLNTKAHAQMTDILLRYANWVAVRFNMRSAYYAKTDRIYVEVKSGDTVVGTLSFLQTDIPANTELTNQKAEEKNFVGLVAGQTYTLTICAVNDEGTYKHPTSLTFIAETAVEVLEVRKVNSKSDNPMSGVLYYALVTSGMYTPSTDSNPKYNLWWLLNKGSDSEPMQLDSDIIIKGATDESDLPYATALPSGLYYGFPKDYGLTTNLKIVNIVSGRPTYWTESTYVVTDYRLQMSVIGEYDSTNDKFVVNIYATPIGTIEGSKAVTVEIYPYPHIPGDTARAVLTGTVRQGSRQLIGTFRYSSATSDQHYITQTTAQDANSVTEVTWNDDDFLRNRDSLGR